MDFFILISIIFWSCIWGFVTKKVIHNKGYEDNWFIWGFLFGIFALIVACSKPPYKEEKTFSVTTADEMIKLKNLLDMNCITQAEYDMQKTKLLGISSQSSSASQLVSTNTQQYACPRCGTLVTYGDPSCKGCGQPFAWQS